MLDMLVLQLFESLLRLSICIHEISADFLAFIGVFTCGPLD